MTWLLIKSEFREVLRRPLGSLFVISSLTIAVMSVLVTHQLSLTIIDRFGQTGLQNTFDYVVYLEEKSETEYFKLRQRWLQGGDSRFSHVVPVVEGSVVVNGQVVNVLGYDPIATLPSVDSGTVALPTNSSFLLEDSVITLGLSESASDSLQGYRVISQLEGGPTRIVADIPTAQNLLGRPFAIDAVWLKLKTSPNPWWEQLVPGLLTAMQSQAVAIDFLHYEALPFSWWNPSTQLGDAIVFNLGMLSLLTLLVAGFISFQAIQNNIRTNLTQIELLANMGLSEKEQRGLLLIQCTFYGLIGCILGIGFGTLLLCVVGDADLPRTWQSLNSAAIAKAFTLGLATTWIVALFVNYKIEKKSGFAFVVGTSIGGAGLLYGIFFESGLLGASLVSVCLCVVNVFCVVPFISHVATRFFTRWNANSMLFRMNVRNAIVTSNDIRMTVNALSIAVATAIGIGMMLSSFRAEFDELLEQRLTDALHLSNAAGFRIEEFDQREDIKSIRQYQHTSSSLDGKPIQLVIADLDSAELARYGYQGKYEKGLLLSEKAAREFDFGIGQVLSLSLPNNSAMSVKIVHLFKDYGEASLRAVIDRKAVDSDMLVVDSFSIETDRKSAVRQALLHQYPSMRVVDSSELRALALLVFDRSFATAQIMVNIAIFVAVIGMVCALLGIQVRRQKEMRLLLMMGISRLRLSIDALTQNALLGLFSVVVAVPLALAIAWNLCYLVNPRAYGWSFDLQLSWETILLPMVYGVVAACLAGLEPLRRALSEVIAEPLSNVP